MAGRRPACALLMAAALALGACSTNIADFPAQVGLPADAPARPEGDVAFPAVHDVPPARPEEPLSEDQVRKMEADLNRAREQQQRAAGVPPAKTTRKNAETADPAGTTKNP